MQSSALCALECINTKEKWRAKRAKLQEPYRNPTKTLQKPYVVVVDVVVVAVVVVVVVVVVGALRASFLYCIIAF